MLEIEQGFWLEFCEVKGVPVTKQFNIRSSYIWLKFSKKLQLDESSCVRIRNHSRKSRNYYNQLIRIRLALCLRYWSVHSVKISFAWISQPRNDSRPHTLALTEHFYCHFVIMSRRYDSRVEHSVLLFSRGKLTQPTPTDNHFLPRRTIVPGRICTWGDITCWHSYRYFVKWWNCLSGWKKGYEQTVGTGHFSGEAIHTERVGLCPPFKYLARFKLIWSI